MPSKYDVACTALRRQPRCWLVTGVAGFIGSNILEKLLALGQEVVGLDNLTTGHRENLDEVKSMVAIDAWDRFRFVEGDIRDFETCGDAVRGVDFVLHQAALGSVPRSLKDPLTTNAVNIDGFVNMLVAARSAGVDRFIYAGSSSTYGDSPALPKKEDNIGSPLSPYAVTKYVNELYAHVFARAYGFRATGLRYFNVFGPRQDPEGTYAAVIPKWASALLNGDRILVNGDGETSRDFCYVANAVQANILAACADQSAQGEVYNVAVGQRTSLNQLLSDLQRALAHHGMERRVAPVYGDFRSGDVRHSHADIGKARDRLGYEPSHTLPQGLVEAMPWYIRLASGSA